MAIPYPAESVAIGLDDESWKQLSSADAGFLLRIVSLPSAEDRTYSSVTLLPPVDGSSLYVQSH